MKQDVLRKLIREEISKVLKEYTTGGSINYQGSDTDQYEPYYVVTDVKKADLPKELKYHGDMKALYGRTITAYFTPEERTVYVSTPEGHTHHAFTCDNEEELKAIVMKYDKVRADQANDIWDTSKTHILDKEN